MPDTFEKIIRHEWDVIGTKTFCKDASKNIKFSTVQFVLNIFAPSFFNNKKGSLAYFAIYSETNL